MGEVKLIYGRLLSKGIIACGVRSAFCERKHGLENLSTISEVKSVVQLECHFGSKNQNCAIQSVVDACSLSIRMQND